MWSTLENDINFRVTSRLINVRHPFLRRICMLQVTYFPSNVVVVFGTVKNESAHPITGCFLERPAVTTEVLFRVLAIHFS